MLDLQVRERLRAHPLPLYVPPAAAAVLALERRCCRWPVGDLDDEGFRFCGAPRDRGSYCAAHRRLASRRRR